MLHTNHPSQTLFLLHGLGDTAASWNGVIAAPLISAYTCNTPNLFHTEETYNGWSLESATDSIAAQIGEMPVHLVGLSLGAVIGLDLAIRYPQQVASLFLAAPQAKVSPGVMRIQKFLMQIAPEKLVCPPGIRKSQLLTVLAALENLDLMPTLPSIKVPTSIICGAKDKANQSAARTIAAAIPGAKLSIIPGAGHQLHTQNPEQVPGILPGT